MLINSLRWGMCGEEVINELDRWCFGDSDITVCHLAEFVLDHQPMGLTIDSFNILPMGLVVLGGQTCKSKINTEALVWQLNISRIEAFLSRGHFFLEFCSNASSALINDREQGTIFEFWNTIAMFVSLDVIDSEK